jgi:hypothetical protein
MKGHGAKFGRKQAEAIAALLTQRNIDEAAKSIGIAPNTLLKWMKQPEFLAVYREARRDAYRQAIARLQQGTSAAATTLLKTMIDPSTPASVKVRAAEAILTTRPGRLKSRISMRACRPWKPQRRTGMQSEGRRTR